MKWLFLVLLIGNAGYFGWGYYGPGQHAEEPREAAVVYSCRGERLVLVSERLPTRAAAKSEPAATPVVAAKTAAPPPKPPIPAKAAPSPASPETRNCYRVAGIEMSTDADILRAALEQRGATVVARGESQSPRQNYWVMLPPFPSRAAANRAIGTIQSKGLSDFYLVRGGESANAISLGVFSTRDAAEARRKQVQSFRLGSAAEIRNLELPAKRFWLSLRWDDEEPDGWQHLIPANEGVELARIACTDAAPQ